MAKINAPATGKISFSNQQDNTYCHNYDADCLVKGYQFPENNTG